MDLHVDREHAALAKGVLQKRPGAGKPGEQPPSKIMSPTEAEMPTYTVETTAIIADNVGASR